MASHSSSVSIRINGKEYVADAEFAGISLANFIRHRTPCQGVKVACGEGGCGACTVAVEELVDGRPQLRTLPSCLTPVFALRGRSVVTAEGLPAKEGGKVSEVAERFASLHASQCGYCTPGLVVACHAALHNARGQQQLAGGCKASTCAGGGNGNGAADGAVACAPRPLLSGPELRGALDGNLCRCTGYRPIVDVARSFLADIEDLATLPPCAAQQQQEQQQQRQEQQPQRQHNGTAPTSAMPAAPAVPAPPLPRVAEAPAGPDAASGASLSSDAQSSKGVPDAGAVGQREDVEEVSLGNEQVLRVPRSLAALVSEAGRLARGSVPWRPVAGCTGHGVYKDWPSGPCVLLDLNTVAELGSLGTVDEQEEEGQGKVLRIGACVTLEQLAAHLDGLAGGDGGGTAAAVRQWAGETSRHVRRIAGRHVRSAASVGGNVALAAEGELPSDLVTALAAAGAHVMLLHVSSDPQTHGSRQRLPLLDYVTARGSRHDGEGASPDTTGAPGPGSLVLWVEVPLPSGRWSRFWSGRVAARYSNAAAVANAAVALAVEEGEGGSGGTRVVGARVVVGLRAPGGPGVRAHNGAKGRDAAAVVLHGWRVGRAEAAEAVLEGAAAGDAGALAAALAALAGRDLPGLLGPEGGEGAAAAVAEGLVAQGLAACLGLVREGEGEGEEGEHAASAVANGGSNGNGHAVPAVPAPCRLPPPPLVHGTQRYPAPVPELAPVTQPVAKLGAHLQASGTAQYTEDVPVHVGSLWGCLVLSARAHVSLVRVDPARALAAPGAVRWVGPGDLAAAGLANLVDPPAVRPQEPLFAEGYAGYAGQPVGMLLADNPWAAQQAAQLVDVEYGPPPSTSSGEGKDASPSLDVPLVPRPILSIDDALAAGSFTPIPPFFPFPSRPGDSVGKGKSLVLEGGCAPGARAGGGKGKDAAPSTSPGQPGRSMQGVLDGVGAPSAAQVALEGPEGGGAGGGGASGAGEGPSPAAGPGAVVVTGRYSTPSQQHVYMETQSAVAWPDEDGMVHVWSGTQSIDIVQEVVCQALHLPLHKVVVRCRRLGGGFGGKATLAKRTAVAAAVGAVITGRQVRVQLPRLADMAINGGRCDGRVGYTAVVGDSGTGRLEALDVHVVMRSGWYPDIAWLDPVSAAHTIQGVYDIPAFRLELALARCHLPPRTSVRGPGEVQGIMIIEQILEHVAAQLGLDPEAVREANFMRCKGKGTENKDKEKGKSEEEATSRRSSKGSGNAPGTNGAVAEEGREQEQQGQEECTLRSALEADGEGKGDREDRSEAAVEEAAAAEACVGGFETVDLPLGGPIPGEQYTLPRLWGQLRRDMDWDRMQAEVAAFNAANPWRKRGLAMVPCRYGMHRSPKPAYVRIMVDGSVQVATHGIEMGQGLYTKVAQVAALTLSEVLPPSQRPLDMGLIRICDNGTELLPNSSATGGSTTSELACAAVRLACLQLVDKLKAFAATMGFADRDDWTWQQLLRATKGIFGSNVQLSAFAWGSVGDLPENAGPGAPVAVTPDYSVFGVGAALVELDVLTGDRRVLRSDILFDLGRPVNPAVDVGQIEGAYVMGLGMMLSEEVSYHGAYGSLLTNSTWHYKPPAATCVPQQLNITVLDKAPLAAAGPVGSKAVGEPPLLLAAAALMALQRAAQAAREGAERVMKLGGRAGSTPSAPPPAPFVPLLAPATVQAVREACGGWSAAELVRATMVDKQ